MKKLVFSALLLFGAITNSQALVVYNDFAPDLTMALGGTLSFDLDGDMNDDITFSSTGMGASDYVISATGATVEFASQGGATAYTESLFIGKVVNAAKTWSTGSTRIASAANKDIAGGKEFFIGLRVAGNNGNYFYGWLLLEVRSNYELVVKSSAFETNFPTIVVGNTGAALLGLDENRAPEMNIFPTLAEDKISIETEAELDQIQVLDLSGKVVLEAETKEIQVGDLPKGSYILNIYTLKGILVQERFIKQ